jgi:enoyl-CoA hydratase/carnithine racemase
LAETAAGAAQLAAWAADCASARAFSPLSERPFLLVAAPAKLPAEVQAWLRRLPCPTIAVGGELECCDTAVADAAEAEVLLANIRRNPIAATVLVQLLRAGEGLPIEDALVAESLAYSTLQSGPEFRRWLEANRAPAPAAHSDSGPAVVVEREGGRLELELNRPSNRNAMTVEMRDALVEALELALADPSISEVRLRGRGKCFSVGGDLTEFGSLPDPATAHLVRGLVLPGRLAARCADRLHAQVHGACIGSGLEFPAFAGRLTAAAGSWFQLPELGLGLIPGAGGCVSIPRRIGRRRTAWLVLSGERITARQALDWGLIDAIA